MKNEPGGHDVRRRLSGGVVSAVNWSEVLQKARDSGRDPMWVSSRLQIFGVRVEEATRGDAVLAAAFWRPGTSLSLADRFCLALAYRFNAPAVTAERAWLDADVGVDVIVIR